MGINNYSQIQSTLFPASGALPQAIIRSSDGILSAYGTVVPVDGSAGYVKGCIFNNTNGTGENVLYYNAGTEVNCDFNPVDGVGNAYGTASGRGPSPAIWAGCPALNYELNPEAGMHYFDDLTDGIVVAANQSVSAAAALGTTGDFAAFTLTGTAISTLATDHKGVVTLTVTVDEDADCRIAYPMNTETAGFFKFTSGKRSWFETRVKSDNVTNAKTNCFIGFMEEARMATGELIAVAGGATADVDYVAFRQDEADGNAWQTHYNTASGGHTVLSATAGVITLNTFHKLGIYCDGTTVFFYIDGVRLADSVALSAANFPDGEEMAFYFGIVAASATTIIQSIDWVKFAQEY